MVPRKAIKLFIVLFYKRFFHNRSVRIFPFKILHLNHENFNCTNPIKHSGSEAYSEHCQTSNMELFAKIVNSFLSLTIFAKSSILDVWQGFEYNSDLFHWLMYSVVRFHVGHFELKEPRKYNRKSFRVSATKTGGNSTNIWNCYFSLWHIRLNIYIWKTKFSSLKQHLFVLLFSRNAKKTHTSQSILQVIYSVWNERSHKVLKYQLEEYLSKVCISLIKLASRNAFNPCDNWKTLFFIKNSAYPQFGATAMLLQRSLKPVLREVRILYHLSPQ